MADSTTPDLFSQEPLPAYQRTSATSRAAAEAVAPKAGTIEARVLRCIFEHGPLTDDEVSRITGIALNSERPRRGHLVEQGLVVSAGVGTNLNGNKATLWARAGDPRIPHPEGPDESGELLRQIHERRPTWLGVVPGQVAYTADGRATDGGVVAMMVVAVEPGGQGPGALAV